MINNLIALFLAFTRLMHQKLSYFNKIYEGFIKKILFVRLKYIISSFLNVVDNYCKICMSFLK